MLFFVRIILNSSQTAAAHHVMRLPDIVMQPPQVRAANTSAS